MAPSHYNFRIVQCDSSLLPPTFHKLKTFAIIYLVQEVKKIQDNVWHHNLSIKLLLSIHNINTEFHKKINVRKTMDLNFCSVHSSFALILILFVVCLFEPEGLRQDNLGAFCFPVIIRRLHWKNTQNWVVGEILNSICRTLKFLCTACPARA